MVLMVVAAWLLLKALESYIAQKKRRLHVFAAAMQALTTFTMVVVVVLEGEKVRRIVRDVKRNEDEGKRNYP